jgi:chemotaxis protein methyltransferase CheR
MLSQHAFACVVELFRQVSGIQLTTAKRSLVEGRLQKLALASGAPDLDTYVQQLLHERDPEELVRVVDKLTTTDTYFFREPQHFEALHRLLAARGTAAGEFRVWSAASSSGEEAYSIAMVLADQLGLKGWEVIGTDLSTAMVDSARRGLYPMERARDLPGTYLKRFCLKGHGDYAGQLLIHKDLRARVHFGSANLTRELPPIGDFDLIFLRNVLIYFDMAGKAEVVRRVLTRLRPNGQLYTGHAESLANLGLPLQALAPAIYRHA